MIPHPRQSTETHRRLTEVMLSCISLDFLLPLHPLRALRHQTPLQPIPKLPLLQSAINLIHNIIMCIIIPINTKLIHTLRNASLLQQLRLLDRVNIQSRANMPRDVAMERPDARIIGFVL